MTDSHSDSCLGRLPDCEECSTGNENHCRNGSTGTYNSRYFDPATKTFTGEKSYGGYADYHRAPSHFVFKIPDELDSADAAPMLCGGITVFSPLVRNGCGPGLKVGIVGVGGLGHFGVLFAKALKADKVVGISRYNDKRKDVLAMGADQYIATEDELGWEDKYRRTLDLIVCTVSSSKVCHLFPLLAPIQYVSRHEGLMPETFKQMPLSSYLKLLRINGKLVQVGLPEDALPTLTASDFTRTGIFLGGSNIGAPHEIREMLELAAKQKVKPWVQTRDMRDANAAVVDQNDGKARYRYTLVNGKHADI